MCPQCHSVYTQESGFTLVNGLRISNNCSHVSWPNHSQPSRRRPCGAVLMKNIRNRSGNNTIQPYKIFPYQSLIEAIQRLVLRDNFLNDIEHWRTRVVPTGFLCDVYEGEIWNKFLTDGFLQYRYNLCLTINTDWFQPFTHTRKLKFCAICCIAICILQFYRILGRRHLFSGAEPPMQYTIQEGECDTYWTNTWC